MLAVASFTEAETLILAPSPLPPRPKETGKKQKIEPSTPGKKELKGNDKSCELIVVLLLINSQMAATQLLDFDSLYQLHHVV
ncbi:hypothetical protein P3L10_022830 [Capsicum annuum]